MAKKIVLKRSKRRRRNKKTPIIKLIGGFILVVLVLWVIIAAPFKTTKIGDEVIHGNVKEKINFSPQDGDYIQTGKPITYDATLVCKGLFGKEVALGAKGNELVITVEEKNLKNKVDINKNKIKISNSVTSGTPVSIRVSYKNQSKTYKYTVRDDLKKKIGEDMFVKNPKEYDCVVNKKRHVSSDYEPDDLVYPDVDYAQTNKTVRQMRKKAARALEDLFKGARENDYIFFAVSGYRPYSMQESIHTSQIREYGSEEEANKYSAKAGESEHQLGLSMDVSINSLSYKLTEELADTDEGKWLAENCHKYGFIIRFPKGKESITGYNYEPWHVRYVGKDLAKLIHDNDLTLEEYFEL